MKSIHPVKHSHSLLSAALLALLGSSAVLAPVSGAVNPDHGIFFDSDYANLLRVNSANSPGSVAIFAGGKVGGSATGGGIRLDQTAFGQMTGGWGTAPSVLVAEGFRRLNLGVDYASLPDIKADHVRSGNSWDIRFAGVINPVTGQQVDPPFNFNEQEVFNAAAYYRAALHADPANRDAALGLLRTGYERIVPRIYAGHNGAERAGRNRLETGDINAEIQMLEAHALSFYSNAAAVVVEMAQRMPEAALLDGSYSFLSPAQLAVNRNRVLDAFSRALAHQAETLLTLGRLKQFAAYRSPLLDHTVDFSGVLAFLDLHRNRIQEQKLLLALWENLPPLAEAGLRQCEYYLTHVGRLKQSIRDGRIAFVAYQPDPQGGTIPEIAFSEYSPEFIPFRRRDPNLDSYEELLNFSERVAGRSRQVEENAKSLQRDFDENQFVLLANLHSLTNRYFNELQNLCGSVNGVPDLKGALVPSQTARGEIGAQWGRIRVAQQEVQASYQDLSATRQQIAKKSEVAREIAGGYENLARIIYANGSVLAALDHAEGNLQATALIEAAEQGEEEAWFQGIVGGLEVAAGIAVTVATAGSALSAGGALAEDGAKRAFGAYSDYNQALESAGLQAELQRNLAAIEVQRTRIATLEKAAVVFQQRDMLLTLTEEALLELMLRAERQKLNILMARQRLANEFLALRNLVGRVQFLLQEFASAVALESSNPLRSPDYRLVRDLTLRDAEESFLLAQRWAYLAAKSLEYRFNNAPGWDAASLTRRILAVRNQNQLDDAITDFRNLAEQFLADTSLTPPLPSIALSLRDDVAQYNRIRSDGSRAAELQPGGRSSQQHWQDFLNAHLHPSEIDPHKRILRIPFSTSLDNWHSTKNNPLFQRPVYNLLIASSPGVAGVEVQITGQNLPATGLFVYLRYDGISLMRSLAACDDPSGQSMNVWQIRLPSGDAYPGYFECGANQWGVGGTDQFDEFSPANCRWTLELYEGDAANNLLFSQLDKIDDIKIQFRTRGFTSSCR